MTEPAATARLLVVEDEPSLRLTLTDRLEAEGYEVETATTVDQALGLVSGQSFDLLLLDVMLPGGADGFDLLKEVRRRNLSTPVMMLTARSQVVDRVVGLRLGADDYLAKPFEMIELLARIDALLRRSRQPAGDEEGTYAFGDVRIDHRSGSVTRADESLALSALEYKLLRYFVGRRGAVLSRQELLDRVWGYSATPVTRTVDVHVASLRQKIEPNPARPRWIVTVHRRGYRFDG